MKGGDKQKSQMMMRGRVAMQGFTILAIYFGVFYKTQYSIFPSSWTSDTSDSSGTSGTSGSNGSSGASTGERK